VYFLRIDSGELKPEVVEKLRKIFKCKKKFLSRNEFQKKLEESLHAETIFM